MLQHILKTFLGWFRWSNPFANFFLFLFLFFFAHLSLSPSSVTLPLMSLRTCRKRARWGEIDAGVDDFLDGLQTQTQKQSSSTFTCSLSPSSLSSPPPSFRSQSPSLDYDDDDDDGSSAPSSAHEDFFEQLTKLSAQGPQERGDDLDDLSGRSSPAALQEDQSEVP